VENRVYAIFIVTETAANLQYTSSLPGKFSLPAMISKLPTLSLFGFKFLQVKSRLAGRSSATMSLLPAALTIGILLAILGTNRVDAQLTTVAGTGEKGYSGTGGPATKAQLNNPFGVIIGPDGDTYFCDTGNHTVRKISRKSGKISTVVGTGEQGYSGDGGPATEALCFEPYEVRFHPGGDLYWVEMQNHIVRRLDARTNTVHTVAGTGEKGFSGDDGPATMATFNRPHSIQFDADGAYLFICDIGNHRIRRVDLDSGMISTFCGNGKKADTPDGAKVSPSTPLNGPRALDRAPNGDLWLALREGNKVYRIDMQKQTLHHVAGNGKKGFTGNGGPALDATLSGPKGVAISPDGKLIYLADTESHSVRAIDLRDDPPTLNLIAGDGKKGTFARLHGVGVDPVTGDLFIGDSENHVVQKIAAGSMGIPTASVAPKIEDFEIDEFEVDGIAAKMLRPKQVAEGRPWIWRCRFFGGFAQADAELAARGWHVAWVEVADLFGGPPAMAIFQKYYAHVVPKYQLAPKSVMEGFSRGGLPAVYWSAANPDKVCGIYLDAPVVDIRSWPSNNRPELWTKCLAAHGITEANLDSWRGPIDALQKSPTAQKIPLLLVAGGADSGVPFPENGATLEKFYQQSAAPISHSLKAIVKATCDHHPHSLHEPAAIVSFARNCFEIK
jgi:DNA-binding beta-propeller fold protein YncE